MPTPSRSALALALACMTWQDATAATDELVDLSLEQLGNVVVTSLSRQQARLSDAAASIYLISASDIRQSGARSLPEALRLAPNLQVARVDARNYAVSARGFNNAFENKLLVLIDGRSVYTPLFSGVFWDAQDVVMEDIERIEVISGPGSTIWGANAVNGVINVITRSAAETQDGFVSAAGGNGERAGVVRYGGKLGAGGHYRVYGKAAAEDDTATAAGFALRTGWRRSQAGFRSDWALARGALTVSGDAYRGALAQANTRDIRTGGANLIAGLSAKPSDDADYRIELILDHTERDQPNAFIESLDAIDLEAQHNVRLGQHRLAWGGGYRHGADRVTNGAAFGFLPGDLSMHWGNLFAQDEIALSDSLRLTAGLKVEHNNYTGAETLPNLRLAWRPAEGALWWSSLSRTVRAPSRIDRDFYAPTNPPIVNGVPQYAIGGGPDFMSETANVAEIGYRAQPTPEFSYSITGFYSQYDHLRTLEPRGGASAVFSNLGDGSTRGVELWGRWRPLPSLGVSAGLVVQGVRTGLKAGSHDASGMTGIATNDPGRHWLLRLSHDLSEAAQFDVTLRYNGSLPAPAVPAYYEMDAQWLWQPRTDIDVALIGENLLHASHAEFGGVARRSVFERGALLKLTKRF